jgi:hypothetical protein
MDLSVLKPDDIAFSKVQALSAVEHDASTSSKRDPHLFRCSVPVGRIFRVRLDGDPGHRDSFRPRILGEEQLMGRDA